MLAAQQCNEEWRKKATLNQYDLHLSQQYLTCNKRTWISAVYEEYVKVSMQWWKVMWRERLQLKYVKLRFQTYQKKQRLYRDIAYDLYGHDIKNSVVAWGAGNFGPTLKGHAAAPNKNVCDELIHHAVQIYLVDEYNTSKYTACCHKRSVYSKQRQQEGTKAKQKQLKHDLESQALLSRTLRGLLYCKWGKKVRGEHGATHRIGHHHHHGNNTEVVDSDEKSSRSDETAQHKQRGGSRPWNRDVSAAISIYHVLYHGCVWWHACLLCPLSFLSTFYFTTKPSIGHFRNWRRRLICCQINTACIGQRACSGALSSHGYRYATHRTYVY